MNSCHMEMKSKSIDESSVVIKIIGRLNIDEVQVLERELDRHLHGKKTIAIDLSEVKYVDSSGIGTLIKAMNMAKNAGAEFILFDINQAILNIFRLAYLDKFFTILTRKELVERYPQFK